MCNSLIELMFKTPRDFAISGGWLCTMLFLLYFHNKNPFSADRQCLIVFVLVKLKLSDLYFLNRNTIACKKIFPINSTNPCHTGKASDQTTSKEKASPVIQNKSNLLPPRNKYLNIPEHRPRKKPAKTTRVSLTDKLPPVVYTQRLHWGIFYTVIPAEGMVLKLTQKYI